MWNELQMPSVSAYQHCFVVTYPEPAFLPPAPILNNKPDWFTET